MKGYMRDYKVHCSGLEICGYETVPSIAQVWVPFVGDNGNVITAFVSL